MGSLRSLMRKEKLEPVRPPIPSDDDVISAVYLGTRQLKTLLSRGADPNAVNGNADSALGIAVLHGELGMIHLLVRYGADLDQRNVCGVTVLHLAVSSYPPGIAPKICNYLLDHGADVNASNSYGWTPLMRAVADDEFHVAKLLIERGADATLRNSNGERALDLLRRKKGSAALRKLLKQVS
ncbi:MAG: ankyrin repeat domain-containing protein [Desulfomonilaceae bacterium]